MGGRRGTQSYDRRLRWQAIPPPLYRRAMLNLLIRGLQPATSDHDRGQRRVTPVAVG
jgi:hypothetical protein